MKINQVKQFVANNVSRFEKKPKKSLFILYDKNNSCCGEYKFIPQNISENLGVKSSMSVTRILSSKLRRAMQEVVCTDKDYIAIKDKNSVADTKILPFEITTTTTVLDFIKDRFLTVRSVSKLTNKLKRLEKDNLVVSSDNIIIYEPLKEKPKYEKSVEFVREGTISEATEKNVCLDRVYTREDSLKRFPYIFW